MAYDGYLIPLSELIGSLWPGDVIELPAGIDEALGGVGVARMDVTPPSEVEAVIVIREEVSVEFPGLTGLELVLGAPPRTPGTPPPEITVIVVGIDLGTPFRFETAMLFELRFPPDVVQALRRVGTPPTQTYEMEPDPRAYVQLEARLGVDGEGGLFFSPITTPELHLPALSIGGSPPPPAPETGPGRIGFILDIPDVSIILDDPAEPPAGLPEGFRGVFIPTAIAKFPPNMNVATDPSIIVENAGLGAGGFSGEISIAFGDPPEASLLGIGLRLRSAGITFAQGTVTEGGFSGELLLPFFERWLGVTVTIGQGGDFAVAIDSAAQESEDAEGTPDGLLVLEKEGVMRLQLDSLGLEREGESFTISIGGRVRPLLGDIDWPELEIQRIQIFPDGSVHIDGGWVDLPTAQTLDFFGFRLSVSRMGFGNEEVDGTVYEWFGADGELALVEGIPIAGSVRGLKFRWPRGLPEQMTVSLEGVGIELEIPGTLELEGSVAFVTRRAGEGLSGLAQERFEGTLRLAITPLRMEVSAQVLVAQVDFPEGRETAFMIVLNTTFPTGILLGATGVSIYGLGGLFAMHMAPDRLVSGAAEKSWYEWWKEGPDEYTVATIDKWEPERGTFAFGLGAQIGTAMDDGFSLNAGVLVAVIVPGPIVIIDGTINLLSQRSGSAGQEGAFHVLIVIDGRAGTFLLAIDIQYSIDGILDVEGGAEAFFNFNDSNDWHIYIGQKDPDTKRIRARILSLVEASTYFMVDPRQLAFGARASLGFRGEYGPVLVVLEIALGFDVTIIWKPFQLTGEIFVRGELAIKVFGIGIGLLIEALLSGSAPSPYHILGILHCKIELFWPLPTLEADVRVEWGPTGTAVPVDPFFKRAAFVHRKAPGKSWELAAGGTGVTVLPADAVVVLSFQRPIGQMTLTGAAVAPAPRTDHVDGRTFRYDVTRITLEEKQGGAYVPFADTDGTAPKVFPLLGDHSVLAPPEAQEPMLALWTVEPYPGATSLSLPDTLGRMPPCGTGVVPTTRHVHWSRVPNGVRYPFDFVHMGVAFAVDLDAGLPAPVVTAGALRTPRVRVRFAEPITGAHVKFRAGFSEAVWVAAFHRGVELSRQLVTITASPEISIVPPGGLLDAIRIEPANVQNPTVLLDRIMFATSRETSDAARGAPPMAPADEAAAYGTLFLRPGREYRLTVRTAVSIDGGAPVPQADRTFELRTLPGPAIETRALVGGAPPPPAANQEDELRDSILNQVATYVAESLPAAGARVFYPDEDVALGFDNPYMQGLYDGALGVRVLDERAQVIADGAAVVALGPFWADPFYLSWLAGLARGACAVGGVPTRRTQELRLAVSGLRKTSSYSIELRAAGKTLHAWPAATSRYPGIAAHLADVVTSGSNVALRDRAVTGAMPTAWIAAVAAARAALEAALAALAAATDALSWHDAGAEVRAARATFGAEAATAYDVMAAAGGVPPGPSDAPRVELTRLAFSGGGAALLAEGPEPFPVPRLAVELRRGASAVPVQVVSNVDGTRLMIAPTSGSLAAGAHTLRWRYRAAADQFAPSRSYAAIDESYDWSLEIP